MDWKTTLLTGGTTPKIKITFHEGSNRRSGVSEKAFPFRFCGLWIHNAHVGLFSKTVHDTKNQNYLSWGDRSEEIRGTWKGLSILDLSVLRVMNSQRVALFFKWWSKRKMFFSFFFLLPDWLYVEARIRRVYVSTPPIKTCLCQMEPNVNKEKQV